MKATKIDKAHLGALGETNVISKLMEHGWSAFNANCGIKNFKSIDVVCFRNNDASPTPWKPDTAFIQVKTSVGSSFPIGFNIEQCLEEGYLETHLMGPYVFVKAEELSNGF